MGHIHTVTWRFPFDWVSKAKQVSLKLNWDFSIL